MGMGCLGLGACSGRPKLALQKSALPGCCLLMSLVGIKGLGTELHRCNQAVPTDAPSQTRHSGSLNHPDMFAEAKQMYCKALWCHYPKIMVSLQRQG